MTAPAANYDRLSRFYDSLSAGFENRFKDAGLALLDIRHGGAVLEVGFGTGYALAKLAGAAGVTGRVSGVDISPGMLATAQCRLLRLGLGQQVELVLGDARSLPFADAEFDAVFTSFTLEVFGPADMARVLAESRRVLRPGGRICSVSLSGKGPLTLVRRLYEWSHRRFPRVVDCRPINATAALAAAGFQVTGGPVSVFLGLAVETVLATRT